MILEPISLYGMDNLYVDEETGYLYVPYTWLVGSGDFATNNNREFRLIIPCDFGLLNVEGFLPFWERLNDYFNHIYFVNPIDDSKLTVFVEDCGNDFSFDIDIANIDVGFTTQAGTLIPWSEDLADLLYDTSDYVVNDLLSDNSKAEGIFTTARGIVSKFTKLYGFHADIEDNQVIITYTNESRVKVSLDILTVSYKVAGFDLTTGYFTIYELQPEWSKALFGLTDLLHRFYKRYKDLLKFGVS